MIGDSRKVKRMKRLLGTLALLAGLAIHPLALPQQAGDFTSLFDGKTLTGWTPVNTTPTTFSLKDGFIHVEGNSGWLRYDKQYTDFQLRVEFRFLTDNADSGVFVRAVGDTIFLRGWPGSSYQVQARDMTRNQTTNPIFIGNIYRHGNRGGETTFDSASAMQAAKKTSEWQTFEIEVRGDRLTAKLNGTQTTTATGIVNPSGYIGLQGEAGIVEYRSIQIREIK
jgi:hypothetical protein